MYEKTPNFHHQSQNSLVVISSDIPLPPGVFAFIDPQSFISVYSNPAIRQLFHTKLVNDEIQWNNCFIIYSTTMPITRRKMKEKREEKHKFPQFLYLPLAWQKASATPKCGGYNSVPAS